MKKNILNLLRPDITPDINTELHELLELCKLNSCKLSSELTAAQAELLLRYTESKDEYCELKAAEAFCEGFALAGKLFAEALT